MQRSETKAIRRAGMRGASTAEYLVLVAFMGLGVSVALIARGKTMLTDYENARDLVLLPAQ